jgi:hypothetical protein
MWRAAIDQCLVLIERAGAPRDTLERATYSVLRVNFPLHHGERLRFFRIAIETQTDVG